jgi:PknH-like extracellular domain
MRGYDARMPDASPRWWSRWSQPVVRAADSLAARSKRTSALVGRSGGGTLRPSAYRRKIKKFFGPASSLRDRPLLMAATVVSVALAVVLIAVTAILLNLLPTMGKHPQRDGQPSGPVTAAALNLDNMRQFVTAYYNDLPARPQDAWVRLDKASQTQTGQSQFFDFWATIGSVELISVSPRDATSVVARLKYVRHNGTSDTEDRWLKMALENGVVLLDGSGRIGSITGETPTPPSTALSPNAIDHIMLSADQLGNLLGVNVTINPAGDGGGSALALKSSSYGMADHSGQVKPPSCVGVAFTGEHDVYAAAEPSAMKIQVFGNQYGGSGNNSAPYYVEQAVAVFATAEQAQQVVKSSQAQWHTCGGTEVDVTLGFENGRGFHLGDVENTGDVAAVPMASWGGLNGLHACQQAIGMRANAVVEARTCEEPSVPNFNWQEPVNPAWASRSATPLVSAMLDSVHN